MTYKLPKPPRNEVLRLLNYKGEYSDETLNLLIDKCEVKLQVSAEPRFIFRIFDKAPFELIGNDIKLHLKGCEKIALFAVTLGSSMDSAIRRLEITRLTEAFILDALAGVSVEMVCDYVEAQISETNPGLYLTTRYSPGYGDFSIETQEAFLESLSANKTIGLYATENNLLTPGKSVTAVIGLSKNPRPQKKYGCKDCALKDKCKFKREGTTCGF